MALLLECFFAFVVTFVVEPNFDPEPTELDSLGSFVNEKAFALNSISKKIDSFKAFFKLIVFMGSDY